VDHLTDQSLSPEHFGVAFKAFLDTVVASAGPPASPLLERIRAHLGSDPSQLPVVAEEFDSFEHPNVQVALEAYLAVGQRQATLLGVAAENKRFAALSLSDLLVRVPGWGRPPLGEGPVDYVNVHLPGERVLACVQFGLYLVQDGPTRLVVLVTGPSDRMGPRVKVRVEALATQPAHAQAFLRELVEGMRRLNVYRGQVLSLAPGPMGMSLQVAFHHLPPVARSDVILPDGLLERIEHQTIAFAEQADWLVRAGRSLKRGLLLYGPPGTGKTLSVMYLVSRMPGRTTILTTGRGMGMIQTVAQMARTLAPAMVVLEDVDLIAEQRGQPMQPTGPLLFELLNEMDGLRDDCDVIFVLTTNRPDILEPALAARPGRIDLVVELPLPDAAGRQRLLALYGRGLELRDLDHAAVVAQTEGASPAYIKELLRKAALLAALEAGGPPPAVLGRHVAAAFEQLNVGGQLARRILGFNQPEDTTRPAAHAPGPPAVGFPTVM